MNVGEVLSLIGEESFWDGPLVIKIDRTGSVVRVVPVHPEFGNIELEILHSIAAALGRFCRNKRKGLEDIWHVEIFKITEDKDDYMNAEYVLWLYLDTVGEYGGEYQVLFYRDRQIFVDDGLDDFNLTLIGAEFAD